MRQLLGREVERTQIEELLSEAREGKSGVLVLRGEAGIGKSVLLEYAHERAKGMTILSARGMESESELAFWGLADLLRPVLDRLERIPARQAEALRGALALGPPGPGHRYAVAAATLSLLAAAAEEAPLLATIDDAHWLDASSAEVLLFAARRLGAEGIILLLSLREGEPTSLEPIGLPLLVLAGLDRTSSQALLEGAVRHISSEVSERLFQTTRGNPLALLELPSLLSEGQLAGREPLEEPLPAGPGIERAFLRRMAKLPPDTQRVLLLAAASESGEMDVITLAAKALDVEPSALQPAESAGLVALEEGRLEWRHPLLRSAVYQAAPGTDQRAAHQALAEALAGHSADRRAWHLAAASLSPDEEVAQALEQAGLAARQRTGHAVAASAFERAARLTPGDEGRARRLLEAARDLQLVGRMDRALELLDDALAHTIDPLLRADIQHLRGSTEMWAQEPANARELLVAEATRVEPLDPGRATRMLAEATIAWTMAGECRAALETARQACAVAERGDPMTQA